MRFWKRKRTGIQRNKINFIITRLPPSINSTSSERCLIRKSPRPEGFSIDVRTVGSRISRGLNPQPSSETVIKSKFSFTSYPTRTFSPGFILFPCLMALRTASHKETMMLVSISSERRNEEESDSTKSSISEIFSSWELNSKISECVNVFSAEAI